MVGALVDLFNQGLRVLDELFLGSGEFIIELRPTLCLAGAWEP